MPEDTPVPNRDLLLQIAGFLTLIVEGHRVSKEEAREYLNKIGRLFT